MRHCLFAFYICSDFRVANIANIYKSSLALQWGGKNIAEREYWTNVFMYIIHVQ